MWRVTTILPRKGTAGTGTGTGIGTRAMLLSRLQQRHNNNNINSENVMQVRRTVPVASRRSASSSSSSNCGFLINNNNTFTQSSSSSSFPFRNDHLRYFSVTTTNNNNDNNNNNNGKSNSNTTISNESIAAEPMDPDDVYNDIGVDGFNDDGYMDDDDEDEDDYDFKNTIADDVLKSAEKEQEEEERERYRLQQEVVNAELDQRTGRPWKDPWEITEDQWSAADTNSETALVDWSPEYVSRISLERIRIFHNKNTGGGIPTLKELSELTLQPEEERGRYSATLHPARDTKKYAAYRKSSYYHSVSHIVQQVASTRVTTLLQEASAVSAATTTTTTGEKNEEWNNTHLQDQVDILFEEVQEEMKDHATMDILSKHPDFHDWVGRSLEEYLRSSMKKVQAQQQLVDSIKAAAAAAAATTTAQEEEGKNNNAVDAEKKKSDDDNDCDEGTEEEVFQATVGDDDTTTLHAPVVPEVPAVPMFMDCYTATDNNNNNSGGGGGGYEEKESTTNTPMVPTILHPLASNTNGNGTIGRMVEEWELSASDVNKRILMRECTQQIATHLLEENESTGTAAGGKRIYLHGKRGIGKSSVLASIVASCRTSTMKSEESGDDNTNYIVMYLPDGDRLSKNGFFIVPNTHRKDCFDLPDLSQQAIQQLLVNHATDVRNLDIHVDTKRLHQFFKETQLQALYEYCGTSNNDESNESDDSTNDDSTSSSSSSSIPLMEIMNYSQEKKLHAPMCYSVMMDVLMTLKRKNTQFVVVMDEYNCLYDHKGHYYHMAYDDSVQTTIPCRQINLFEPIMNYMKLTVNEDEDNDDVDDQEENRITASVIVGTTESHAIRRTVTDALTTCAEEKKTPNFLCVEIPRFTSMEVDHIIANYEATGIGKLRLDRGTTLMNAQEMAYLKMCSGSIGQRLLDVSIC